MQEADEGKETLRDTLVTVGGRSEVIAGIVEMVE